MPFQPGHKLAKGGKRPGAGRPRLEAAEIKKTAAELARAYLDKHGARVMETYIQLATKGLDPATTRHAVDKLIPDGFTQNQGQGFNVFIGINAKDAGPESAVRPDSLQIHLGGNNGQNGDGEDSA